MANIDSLPIPSSSSIISFEVGDLLDSWNPPVLAESLSIDTLSTSSSAISVPSLPLGCMISRPAIVDLKGGLQSRFAKVTVPTAPRMRAMLKDEPCVDRWLDNLRYSSIPGHSPWGETEDAAAPSWLPEGSIYTPEAFRQALSSARSSPAYQTIFRKARSSAPGDGSSSPTSPTPISPTLLRRMSYHPSSFRDALVFEREISLKSEAGVKRWSMQVPASTMKPELVDIVVELQKLNSFFNDGLTDLNQGVSALDKHKQRVTTPALTVSDSHETIPLPLERVKENTTTLIANRRGKKAPPALNLKRQTPEDTYPGIPTAFLWTPSAYHPELDPRPKREGPAMNINDMISSLRSQCAAISRSPTSEVASSPLASVSEEPEESKVARNHDNAQDYMSVKDQQALAFSVAIPQLSDDESLMRRTLPLDLVDIQETLSDVGSDHLTESFSDFLREFESEALQPPSMPGTPMMPPSLPLPSLPIPSLPPLTLPAVPTRALPDPPAGALDDHRNTPNDHHTSLDDHRTSLDDMDWSPPTPPQPCRSPSPSLSPRQGGLRGILKGGKNVRFASLPTNRQETSPGAIEAYAAGRAGGEEWGAGDDDEEERGSWGAEGQWAVNQREDVMEDYSSRERKGSILKSPTEASDSSRSSVESVRSPTELAYKQSPKATRPPLVGRHSTGSAPARLPSVPARQPSVPARQQPSPVPRRPSPLRSTFTASAGVVPAVPALPVGVRASMISPARSSPRSTMPAVAKPTIASSARSTMPATARSTTPAPAKSPSTPSRSTLPATAKSIPISPARLMSSPAKTAIISPNKSRMSYAPVKVTPGASKVASPSAASGRTTPAASGRTTPSTISRIPAASGRVTPTQGRATPTQAKVTPTQGKATPTSRIPAASGRVTPTNLGRTTPTAAKPTSPATAKSRAISMMPPPRTAESSRRTSTPVSPPRQRPPLTRASVANGVLSSVKDSSALYTKPARPMTIGGPIKLDNEVSKPLESPRRAPATPAAGKENMIPSSGTVRGSKMAAPASLGRKAGAYKDENAARNDGTGTTRSEGGKSRMPVPLRNILTRFNK